MNASNWVNFASLFPSLAPQNGSYQTDGAQQSSKIYDFAE
jgi:hypothetical protein